MKLYVTPLGQWAGTQADARAFKATHGVDFEQIDVPTDKPGLLEFLNRHMVGALEQLPDRGGDFENPAPNEAEDLFEQTHGKIIREVSHPLTTMAIEDWCERAQPHQLGTIMRAASLRLQQISQEVQP